MDKVYPESLPAIVPFAHKPWTQNDCKFDLNSRFVELEIGSFYFTGKSR